MLPRQLIEIAGLVSLQSAPLLRCGAKVCSEALSEYWIASRCRLDEWSRLLKTLGHSQTTPPGNEGGDLLVRLVEEITLAGMLTRTIAAICCAYDHQQGKEDAGPIGLNALETHTDTASRLRAITFAWWPADSARSRHARSLSKQADHWTDMLLAYVSLAAPIDHLSIDVARLREFAYDSQVHGQDASQAARQLLHYAMRTGFAEANQPALNPELNRRIAGAAVALFGDAGFDGHGLSKPVWMLRAERAAEDTTTLIERLFDEEETPAAIRLPARWRI